MLHLFALSAALLLAPMPPVRTQRHAAVAMKVLRHQKGASAKMTQAAIEGFLNNSGDNGIVVLHFTEADAMSNVVFERTADKYAASQMHGGAPCVYVQITRGDGGAQDAVCAARGIEAFPTTELWQGGARTAVVSAFELEDALLELGAQCAGGENARKRRRAADKGKGLPNANAVDEIDFTGGAGEGGRPINRQWKGKRGITTDYFGMNDDKPEPPKGTNK